MRFHLPSFLFGVAIGVGMSEFKQHLRPIVVDIATSIYRLGDRVAVALAMRREDVQDIFAEARARARRRSAPQPGHDGGAVA